MVNELVHASLEFPTVVFSLGLAIALVYWLFVVLGALDIDLFGDASAAKGAADAIVGATKGGAEALKGMHADADADVDVDAGGFWNLLGLGAVPITISISMIVLVGWILSLAVMQYVFAGSGLGSWFPALLLVVVLVIAMPIAGLLVRPIAPFFAVKEGKSNADYVGHTCVITTGRVDDEFGQATVEDGGTVLVIPVRCDRPDTLSRGSHALIIDFDQTRQAYVVEPQA